MALAGNRERLHRVVPSGDTPGSWYVLAEKDQAVPEESRGGPIN
jgi:hypothetical protein